MTPLRIRIAATVVTGGAIVGARWWPSVWTLGTLLASLIADLCVPSIPGDEINYHL